MPLEDDRANYDDHENIRLDVLEPLRDKAKAAGLFAPQMPKARGGLGLPVVGWAAFYEEANRSIFGPLASTAGAGRRQHERPQQGAEDRSQKDKWLQPIIDGTCARPS